MSPGIGDVTDSSTWQTLGGGVADYLSALPLPLHHLLKYSTPATISETKREDQSNIVTNVHSNAMNAVPTITSVSIIFVCKYSFLILFCLDQNIFENYSGSVHHFMHKWISLYIFQKKLTFICIR